MEAERTAADLQVVGIEASVIRIEVMCGLFPQALLSVERPEAEMMKSQLQVSTQLPPNFLPTHSLYPPLVLIIYNFNNYYK